MDFTSHINAELLTLVPVLNAVGWWLKHKTKLKNSYIPLVLGVVSVILATVYTIGTAEEKNANAAFTGVIQGVLLASSAVYANQVYKQLNETEE